VATLYVRDVPDELYARLKTRAEEQGRSLTAETIVLLRRALDAEWPEQRDVLARIAARPRFSPAAAGAPGSTEMLRDDRAR
jgi:plasmid stability protein